MDNGQIEKIDSRKAALESWGFKTGMICGIGCVCIGRFCFAMEWVYAVLAALPVIGLVNALIVAHAGKIFSNALWFSVLPVLRGMQSVIGSALIPLLPEKITGDQQRILVSLAVAALFLVSRIICALIALAVPEWKMHWKLHKRLLLFLRGLGVFMVFSSLLAGLAAADRQWGLVSGCRIIVVPVAFVLLLLAFYKIFREVNSLGSATQMDSCAEEQTALLVSRPSIRMKDVAGMDEVKDQIRLRLIEPVRDPKRAKQFGLKVGGGMLLYGPPGTGKTFIAKAVAGELELPFYTITAADIFGRYVGESEQKLRELFASARKHPLSVIFIDELETIFRKRTDEIHEVTQKVISLLLQELDGIGGEGKNPVLLMGATNMPWQVDEAFLRPGRFDILAFVDLPDYPARRQIIGHAFGAVAVAPALLDYIAENTEHYSGADLNGVAMRIKQQAFDRRAKSVSPEIVQSVLASSRPSDNREIMARLRKWRDSRNV